MKPFTTLCFATGLSALTAAAQTRCPSCIETRLFTGNPGYSAVAVDATYAYMAGNTGAVQRVPKTGGTAEIIATWPTARSTTGLDIDETNLYLGVVAPLPQGYSGNYGTIARVSKNGGAFTTLTDLATNVVFLAVDSTHVYWCSYGTWTNNSYLANGFIARVPKAGGAVEFLAQNVSIPYGLVLDGTNVYYGESGYASGPSNPGIKRVPKTGGSPPYQVYSGVAAYVDVDQDYVYATSAFSGEVFRVPKTGGVRTVYASGVIFPDTLHVRDGQLYFTSDDNCSGNGFIAVVDLANGNSRILRTGLPCALPTALDDCAVYVASKDGNQVGSLDRLCRPQSPLPPTTNTFGFSAGSYTVDEWGSYVNVYVQRTGDTNLAGSVWCRTEGGTAASGVDYIAATNQVSFAAGEAEKMVSLWINDDVAAEPNETFNVVLFNPSVGTSLGANVTTTVTIVDNDSPGAGKLDPTYTNAVGSTYSGAVNALVAQADGTCYIGGQFTTVNGVTRKYLARLKPDGSLDAGFDPAGGPSYALQSLALQTDGKVLIGGQFFNYNGDASVRYLARVNTNGTLDTNFHAAVVTNNNIYAIRVQPDGKLLVGAALGFNNTNFARLNSDGSLDGGFNVGAGANGTVYAIALDSTNNVLVGGNFTALNGVARTNLVRLSPSGVIDPNFKPAVLGALYSTYVEALLPLPSGKILVAGSFTNVAGAARQNIARLNGDGSLDSTFNAGTNFNSVIYALVGLPDGKVLVGGAFNIYGARNNYIVRMNADGTLEPTFDTGKGPNGNVNAVASLASGQVLIGGGFTTVNNIAQRFVARLLNPNTRPFLATPRVSAGNFGFAFTTSPTASYTVETSTNLINWEPVWSAPGNGGPTNFADPVSSQRTRRYYRLQQQ